MRQSNALRGNTHESVPIIQSLAWSLRSTQLYGAAARNKQQTPQVVIPSQLVRRAAQVEQNEEDDEEEQDDAYGELSSTSRRPRSSFKEWVREKLSEESLRQAFFGGGHKCNNLHAGKPCHVNLWGDVHDGIAQLKHHRAPRARVSKGKMYSFL